MKYVPTIRLLIAYILLSGMSGCDRDDHQLEQRVSFWKSELQSGVPLGSSADVAVAWGNTHGVSLDLLPEQKWLYGIIERVPEKGIAFPCSEWNIVIRIQLDEHGKTAENFVETVGTCV